MLRLFGGVVVRLEGERVTPIATDAPVRRLIVSTDGVYGELAPLVPRTDFSRPPETRLAHLAPATLDVPIALPPRPPSRCAEHRLGPTCTMTTCDRAIELSCGGTPVLLDPLPVAFDGWIHPTPFGDDQRFVLDLGSYHLATREDARVHFTPLELPRGWSRELRSARGRWLHLPSTRDHHAPGETDVLFDLETGETVDLGAFRGRERTQLLDDGTLFVLRLDDGAPRASAGPAPGPLAPITAPDDVLDLSFLDARRGVAVGRDGSTLRVTCDAGATWRPLPFGPNAPTQIPEDGELPTPGLVHCEDEACAVHLDPPVVVDFDRARAAGRQRPMAPVRPLPAPAARAPVRRYACRPTGPHPVLPAPNPPQVTRDGAGCVAAWSGRDASGAYRARSARFDCSLVPEHAPTPFARTRVGVLLGEPRVPGATWIVAGGGAHRLEDLGRLRAITLPDGRLLSYAQPQREPSRATLLGPHGVEARVVIDFDLANGSLGAFVDARGPAVLAMRTGWDGAPARSFRVPLDGGLPTAVALGWTPCATEATGGARALLPLPPLYFDGPDDRPFAHLAELRLDAPACLERVASWQGDLRPHGDRLEGLGFVCDPP
ncbi:MAG: hypothetical protein R3B82_10600 [Sandaracinaceae bacterium]